MGQGLRGTGAVTESTASRFGCKENPPRALFVGFGKLYARPPSRNNRRGYSLKTGQQAQGKK